MYVKMLTRMAGPTLNAEPGQVLQLPDEAARKLVNGGYAVMVAAPAPTAPEGPPASGPVETTSAEPTDAEKSAATSASSGSGKAASGRRGRRKQSKAQ